MGIHYYVKEIIMRKFDVAIIDSGLSMLYGNLVNHEGINFYVFNNIIQINNKYYDESGHGTACTHIINNIVNSDISYYIIKILNKKNLSYPEFLVNAIEYLLSIEVDIINLSLSLYNDKYIKKIKELVNKLLLQDKIIIASSDNKQYINVFSNIPGVYTVIGIPEMKSNQITIKDNIIYTSNIPVFVPFVDDINKYYLFGGNSKATALATGLISKIKQINNISANHMVMDYIKEHSPYNFPIDNRITNEISEYSLQSHLLMRKILTNYISVTIESDQKNLFEIGLNRFNVFDLIQDIEKKFDVDIDINKIDYNDFVNINSLLKLTYYSV
jgi:Phosphopantetheine attachment site.